MNLVLLGAPGSGKGTQAKELSEKYNIDKVSLGDILRKEAGKGTSLAKQLKEYMRQGVLVPDDIIKEVVGKSINNKGFVLDGFPRNLNQAEDLAGILREKKIILDMVIYLKVSQSTAVRRLSGRRICRNCGALYHLVTMPSKKEGVCDRCGNSLIIRDDDKEETVKKRWEVFLKETHSLIDYYHNKSILLEVDGNKDKDEVLEVISAEFGRREQPRDDQD